MRLSLRRRPGRRARLGQRAADALSRQVEQGREAAGRMTERVAEGTHGLTDRAQEGSRGLRSDARGSLESLAAMQPRRRQRSRRRAGGSVVLLLVLAAAAAAAYLWWQRQRRDEEYARLQHEPDRPYDGPAFPGEPQHAPDEASTPDSPTPTSPEPRTVSSAQPASAGARATTGDVGAPARVSEPAFTPSSFGAPVEGTPPSNSVSPRGAIEGSRRSASRLVFRTPEALKPPVRPSMPPAISEPGRDLPG